MGTKFKEVNTLSFIGHIGPQTERVWKEVDEEIDIIGCKEKKARPCELIAPLGLLQKDLPGDGDTKQVAIFVNDDVRIELMYCRADEVFRFGQPPKGYAPQAFATLFSAQRRACHWPEQECIGVDTVVTQRLRDGAAQCVDTGMCHAGTY